MSVKKHRAIIILSLSTLLAFSFGALAIWQFKRYLYNKAAVERRNFKLNESPLKVTHIDEFLHSDFQLKKVTFSGVINKNLYIAVPGKSSSGDSGRHIYIFATNEKSHYWILINAGFISTKTNPQVHFQSLPNTAIIEGVLTEMYPMRDTSLYRKGDQAEYAIPELNSENIRKLTGVKILNGIVESLKPLSADFEKISARVVIKPEMNFVYFLQWVALFLITLWWAYQTIKNLHQK